MSIVAETRLRVRYADTDQMGVVYYSNYLIWMEIGRTDFCMESGFRYRDMEADDGIAIAVADVSVAGIMRPHATMTRSWCAHH